MSSSYFEPVFRDEIGYCNVACGDYDWHSDSGESVRCLHRDNGAVCIPWVLSLLLKEPPKTQAQRDAEWLRALEGAGFRILIPETKRRLKEIADRLEAQKE